MGYPRHLILRTPFLAAGDLGSTGSSRDNKTRELSTRACAKPWRKEQACGEHPRSRTCGAPRQVEGLFPEFGLQEECNWLARLGHASAAVCRGVCGVSYPRVGFGSGDWGLGKPVLNTRNAPILYSHSSPHDPVHFSCISFKMADEKVAPAAATPYVDNSD